MEGFRLELVINLTTSTLNEMCWKRESRYGFMIWHVTTTDVTIAIAPQHLYILNSFGDIENQECFAFAS